MRRNGRPHILGGNTGVDTQAQGQLSNHRAPNDLQVERGFPPARAAPAEKLDTLTLSRCLADSQMQGGVV